MRYRVIVEQPPVVEIKASRVPQMSAPEPSCRSFVSVASPLSMHVHPFAPTSPMSRSVYTWLAATTWSNVETFGCDGSWLVTAMPARGNAM